MYVLHKTLKLLCLYSRLLYIDPIFLLFLFKDLTSCTDSCESSSECGCSESCEDEDSEDWHEDVDDLLEDMAGDEPLPKPTHHQSSVQKLPTLTTLIQWLIYFLLFWQASTKLSDNGLKWLL